jgi:ATP-binding cassette subfamily B protein
MTAFLAAGNTADPLDSSATRRKPRAARNAASLLDLYRDIWRYAAGARAQYIGAMGMLGASSAIKLLIPMLAASAINAVQLAGSGSMAHAGWMILGIIGVQAVVWMLHGPGRVMERSVGMRVRANAADAIYSKLIALPLGWHEQHHSGEVQHRTQQATGALYEFTQNQFIYLQNAVNLIGPLVALALLSLTTGTVALAGYVVLALIIVRFDRAIMKLQVTENSAERRYVAGLLDLLGNVSTVLSLRVGAASRALLGERLTAIFAPLRRNIVLNEAKWCAVDLLGVVLCWSLVAIYAWQAHRGSSAGGAPLLIGSVFMVFQYAQQAANVISSMAGNFQNFARIQTNVASADPIWNAESRATCNVAINEGWQQIDARGIQFQYPGHSRGGVHDLTLNLRRGERVALIGPSGSGKSTLLRLIAGLYEPQHGYYSVDGETIFGARHLAPIATLIPQEAEVFEATIRENLSFGVAHDNALIERAAHLSAFDQVLSAMPLGLETPISERGFNLSGGQRQRLALTRGLLAALGGERASSIILLDEPTSALDQVTEGRVFKRLREQLPDTTLIASVHRLSVLDQFDKVVLMADGGVVDCGTPAELYERQSLFRDMLRESESQRSAVEIVAQTV